MWRFQNVITRNVNSQIGLELIRDSTGSKRPLLVDVYVKATKFKARNQDITHFRHKFCRHKTKYPVSNNNNNNNSQRKNIYCAFYFTLIQIMWLHGSTQGPSLRYSFNLTLCSGPSVRS